MKRCVPTLLLVPNTLLWEGLARLLALTDYKPIKCSGSLDELLQGAEFDPKCAMFLVGWDSGARARNGNASLNDVSQLRERFPLSNIIVMSAVCDVDSVIASLHAGADGYVLSSMTCDVLTKSFDLVMAGETVLPSEFTRAFSVAKIATQNLAVASVTSPTSNGSLVSELQNRPIERQEVRNLSGRELTIMSRLREGDSNKIIARRIGLAEATVKTHVKAILRKVGVKNRTQAALWAIANLGTSADAEDRLEPQPAPTDEISDASNGTTVANAEPPHMGKGRLNVTHPASFEQPHKSNGGLKAELPHLRSKSERQFSRPVVRQRSRATFE